MAPVRKYYRSSEVERKKPENIETIAGILSEVSQHCTGEEYLLYLEAVRAEVKK